MFNQPRSPRNMQISTYLINGVPSLELFLCCDLFMKVSPSSGQTTSTDGNLSDNQDTVNAATHSGSWWHARQRKKRKTRRIANLHLNIKSVHRSSVHTAMCGRIRFRSVTSNMQLYSCRWTFYACALPGKQRCGCPVLWGMLSQTRKVDLDTT